MANEHWEILNNGSIVVSHTPEGLWNLAAEYFRWCDTHPIETKKPITSGKGAGTDFTSKRRRPYTIKALCIHCGISEDYLRDIRASKDRSSTWYIVVERILAVIYTQNLENAMVDEFNPIMTAKVLNMEKDDNGANKAITVNLVSEGIPELAKSENEILEKLNQEIAEKEKLKSENPDRSI